MTPISNESRHQSRPVEFQSNGLAIRGILYLPNTEAPSPIVILGHGLNGLKEWTLPEVADVLAKAGIAALCFDYRNYGDSEGQPRDEVDHYGRLQDWQSAITYATTLPEIDSTKVGIWGTSLGGRDVLAVGAIDRRVKAVLSQTPLIKWLPINGARMGGFGDDIEAFYNALAEDRKARMLGKEPRYLPFVKPSGDDSKAAFIDSMTETESRNYSGRLTLQSYQPTALIDVTALVPLITPTPVCFILAEKDFLPGQREAYEAVNEPKFLVNIPGDHFAPYTQSKTESFNATKEFFIQHLVST
jgi:fermentation-respiration switch protein FrsA (DUF1100 family)